MLFDNGQESFQRFRRAFKASNPRPRRRLPAEAFCCAQREREGLCSQIHSVFLWKTGLREGRAGWNRSRRTVTVNSEYLQRFIAQGVKAEAQSKAK